LASDTSKEILEIALFIANFNFLKVICGGMRSPAAIWNTFQSGEKPKEITSFGVTDSEVK